MVPKQSFPLLIIASFVWVTSVQAHSPVEFLEVLEGKPSTLIEHGVELKSQIDDEKQSTNLTGPHFFSVAVGCMDRTVKTPKAYLSWYKIVDPRKSDRRKLSVVDLVRGADGEPLTIGSAEYFLSPSQRISTGPPSSIPDGLDHYKAYRIVDSRRRELAVNLSGSKGKANRIVGKPLFLCVAAEEWHHDEHLQASHTRACFVVYELDEQVSSEEISLIDQFGLNQIRSSKSRWLCVSGYMRNKTPE